MVAFLSNLSPQIDTNEEREEAAAAAAIQRSSFRFHVLEENKLRQTSRLVAEKRIFAQ